MSYDETISNLAQDPEQLEQVYQVALKTGDAESFKEAVDASHTKEPENMLYAAWFHRLKYTAAQAKGHVVAWAWVVSLGAINAILFWWLSSDQFTITITGFQGAESDFLPVIAILASSLTAVLVLVYLTVVGRGDRRLSALIGILLLIAGAYVLLIYSQTGIRFFQEQYLTLMVLHLPLLAWAGVGAFLIARHRDSANRISFLIKSLEVIGAGGMFLIVLGLFTAITVGLFEALDVDFPETVLRLFIAGGTGLIAVVATDVVYNPTAPPDEQSFDQGIYRLASPLVRALLPLTLLVLIVYIVFIPFNFRAPFDSREVLIIYNVMLFAVIALLLGAAWIRPGELSSRMTSWLRWSVIAIAALALIVSLYALAAILYRTNIDRLTPNRFAIIGWNVVNIGLLILILVLQFRARERRFQQGLYRAYSAGTVAYTLWTVIVIVAIPWLFGVNKEAVESLPVTVQKLVYEQPEPILLKCFGSQHIYLLEDGEKRWINNIDTFNDRNYVWHNVFNVPCNDLRTVPDGVPIPANAGPPPQP